MPGEGAYRPRMGEPGADRVRTTGMPVRLLVLALLLAAPARAQEPATLSYRTELAPSGDGALDSALRGVSQLVQLQGPAPTDAAGLVARAMADLPRLRQALQAEGWWLGEPDITLAGQPAGTPGLAEALDSSGERPVPVRISVERGPAFTIGQVAVRPTEDAGLPAVAAAASTPFGLVEGDPARAAAVLAAERQVLDRLLAAGHPLASVVRRETVVDTIGHRMEVAWLLAPGPRARFAWPEVAGSTRMDHDFLRRQVAPLAGQTYSPAALERQRQQLMGLGAFASVGTRAAERLNPDGTLPVSFLVNDRARRAVGVSGAYETNYGPSARVYWEHRNLFGGAERLRVEGEVARLGNAGDLGRSTYRLGATLTDPGVLRPDVTMISNVTALREALKAYDRTAFTGSVLLQQQVSPRFSLRAGPVVDVGGIGPPDGKLTAYGVLGFLAGARWDTTDSLLDPSRGWRLDGALTPSLSLANTEPYVAGRVTGTTYWDLLGEKQGILAARTSFGSLLGANRAVVPRHLRYYAGGGGSVRGYDYQGIGPRDARNQPDGGASVLEASAEWRQRVRGDIGAVVFVDAGAVGTGALPDLAETRVGAGAGVRYFTPIGPIRLDVALPLVKQRGSSGYGIYVGIGQAF